MGGVVRVRVNRAYTSSIRAAGLLPLVLPVLDPDDADAALEGMTGLVLTGGEDVRPVRYGARAHPALGEVNDERDAFEIALVHAARARRLPTLAICRGIQILNVALGGSLVQDLPSERPGDVAHDGDWARSARVHPVRITAGSRLARAIGSEAPLVNSMHHQALATIAPGLSAVAHAPDQVVEGIEWSGEDWWMLGVQWHPEELTGDGEPWDRALLSSFAARARGSARVN
jgi:putative glutamine amidotransferase